MPPCKKRKEKATPQAQTVDGCFSIGVEEQPSISGVLQPIDQQDTKLFEGFRKSANSASEFETLSHSTRITKRKFGRVAHLKEPKLDLTKYASLLTSGEAYDINRIDDDDEEVVSYGEFVSESEKTNRTPTTRGFMTRNCFSDGRKTPKQNCSLPEKRSQSARGRGRKKSIEKCILDQSNTEEKLLGVSRRCLRPRKKVAYREMSLGKFEFEESFTPKKSFKFSRKLEPLRSEKVASPEGLQCSAPPFVDVEDVSQPLLLVDCEPVAAECSPPPRMVEMVQPSPPKSSRPRIKKRTKMLTFPDTARQLSSASTSTVDPLRTQDEMVNSGTISSLSRSPFLTDSLGPGWIDDVSDLITSLVKTFLNGAKSDNTSILESFGVNLTSCLNVFQTTLNTVRGECLNICRSAANVQSACDSALVHCDVALEMMKVIEGIHRESIVATSVRHNDPRTYSRLRQKIHELIVNSSR